MDIKLVPIPLAAVEPTSPHWLPFVEQIADRSREHTSELIRMVESGEVHLILFWDHDAKASVALMGVRIVARGYDRIAEMKWMTGRQRRTWQQLLPEIETYVRDHLGCAGIRAVARPGWMKVLKPYGYRMTHVMAEKALPSA